jgi:hypothetical protein
VEVDVGELYAFPGGSEEENEVAVVGVVSGNKVTVGMHASWSSHKVHTVHRNASGLLEHLLAHSSARQRSRLVHPRCINFWNDLCKSTGGDVPYLDKARIEETNVRLMERDSLCSSCPFDSVA